jgi:hypothetical protein
MARGFEAPLRAIRHGAPRFLARRPSATPSRDCRPSVENSRAGAKTRPRGVNGGKVSSSNNGVLRSSNPLVDVRSGHRRWTPTLDTDATARRAPTRGHVPARLHVRRGYACALGGGGLGRSRGSV